MTEKPKRYLTLDEHLIQFGHLPPPFNSHSCWKCQDGEKPCPDNYRGCEYLHARND